MIAIWRPTSSKFACCAHAVCDDAVTKAAKAALRIREMFMDGSFAGADKWQSVARKDEMSIF
jgi:hypothetical protein